MNSPIGMFSTPGMVAVVVVVFALCFRVAIFKWTGRTIADYFIAAIEGVLDVCNAGVDAMRNAQSTYRRRKTYHACMRESQRQVEI